MAWTIVNEDVQAPASLTVAIRKHAAGLVEDEFMSPDLEQHRYGDPPTWAILTTEALARPEV
ncbi:hypothetical protein FKR81_42900 [Lentzea tibetensis]|uniref:Uncharacterized protein n=1 Tax=Lentzea tibetensis TaxID=2591470 RepID=A0A563EE57_9PSEU|nr:hypothetical protein [Lentzea tibetensis]TWP43039.1 hypothetical protein FKR81_42900 [Lentzea tibetensis]